MNKNSLSTSEKFITEFHNKNPGITSNVFSNLVVSNGSESFLSPYQCLTDLVHNKPGLLTVLDLACGDGFLLSILADRQQQGLSLLGNDISQGEIEAARLRLDDSATVSLSKAQNLTLADDSVDIVLCHMALMLMEDVEKVLSEVSRVLKRGGVFSAIIGTNSKLPQQVVKIFTSLLKQYKRLDEFETVRFGDPLIRSDEGINTIFKKNFRQLKIEFLHNKQLLTAQELWNWFYQMYDLHMLEKENVSDLEKRFVSSVEALLNDSSAKIEYHTNLKQITAYTI